MRNRNDHNCIKFLAIFSNIFGAIQLALADTCQWRWDWKWMLIELLFWGKVYHFLDLSPLGSGSQENDSGEGNIELPELWEEGYSGALEFRGRKCLHQL